MKRLIFAFLLVTTSISAQTGLDSVMLEEINRVRTNPKSYVPLIEDYIKSKQLFLKRIKSGTTKYVSVQGTKDKNNKFKPNGVKTIGKSAVLKDIKAARELINTLKKMKPVGELTFCTLMDSITDVQGMYLDSIGRFGHYGPNGNRLSDRFKGLKPMTSVSENVGAIRKNSVSKNFTDIMVELLVDGHIKSRGHRKNILNPKSKFVSIYISDKHFIQNFLY